MERVRLLVGVVVESTILSMVDCYIAGIYCQ